MAGVYQEEIRNIHPYVSESTINRALINLRDSGYIKPIGKGRCKMDENTKRLSE